LGVDKSNRATTSQGTGGQRADSHAIADRADILLAQDGDKDAYGKLVLEYQKRLYRFIFMMLGSKDSTEDIVQEAFVKGYLALNSFDSDKPFYPWVATIARNLALNRIKKTEKEKPASEYDDLIGSVPDKATNPLDSLINKENDRRLALAVAALPEQYRVVFALRTFEKLSYEEIAKQLKIAVGTVDSRLYRARGKLVQLLKDLL
jgi:RNA polymerase sigma-70 factor (ECF subfamily)